MLQLRLLGAFEARDAASGRAIAIGSRKNRAMLAYLALHPGHAAARSALAGLLWRDRDEAHARNSLRQALLALRRDLAALDPVPVLVEEDRIGLAPGLVQSDALRFKQLAVSAAPADLQEAVESYGGSFLDHLAIQDPGLQDWIEETRAELAELLSSALERLWRKLEGDDRAAALRRLLSVDPARESAHQALMIEIARGGDLAGALQQYERCKQALRQALDVRPSPQTEETRRRILEGRLEVAPGPAGAATGASEARPPVLPAVAVMPFFNVGGDSEQQYFSDGITQDLITDLSRFAELRVIASHSTFAYRGKPVEVAAVARELGVRYVVEGSVQRLGRQIRINAQLIEADSGTYLWSERYSRSLRALFAVQDEIVRAIVSVVTVRVEISERERAMRKTTGNLEAYDYYLRGSEVCHDWTREANRRAREHFAKAIELDRSFARAHGALSYSLIQACAGGWAEAPEEYLRQSRELAQTAVNLAASDFESHHSLGFACLYCRDFDRSLACYERARELNPHSPDLLADMADALVHIGRTAEAVEMIAEAKRLNPISPDWYDWVLGLAAYHDGRFEAAHEALSRVGNPPNFLRRHLAAICVCLGRMEEARAVAAEILRHQPEYRLSQETLTPYKDPRVMEALIDQLRRAGLPD